MFNSINLDRHLSDVRKLLNCSFQTVADDFGLTKENAPTNPAFLDENAILKTLQGKNINFYGKWEEACLISCYALEVVPNEYTILERVCVKPDKRHSGIGKELLLDSLQRSIDFGAKTIKIALIDENKELKKWYKDFGYIEIETKRFNHLPFTVCYMEYIIMAS